MGEAMRSKSTYPLFITMLLSAGAIRAQTWFPTGANWQHEYFNWSVQGYTRMVADGDTLLGGEQARVLRREIVAAYASPPYPVSTFPRSPFAVLESAGLVRIWVDPQATFDTLWNMNAAPGDRWRMAPMTESIVCDPVSYTEVVDTGHVSIDGILLRWLAVDNHFIWSGPDLGVQRDTIIERIGPSWHYFTSHDFCNGRVDGADGGALRCYTDGELNYNRIAPWSCETLLGVAEAPAHTMARMITDGEGCFRVRLAGPFSSVRLELFDATGRVLGDRAVRNDDLVGIGAASFLFYRITDGQGHVLGSGTVASD